jgi:hypothetical protein
MLITDAIMHELPPHISQLVVGHRDLKLGYKAVYPEEVVNGHRTLIARRQALRPSQEYRTPTGAEPGESLWGSFNRADIKLFLITFAGTVAANVVTVLVVAVAVILVQHRVPGLHVGHLAFALSGDFLLHASTLQYLAQFVDYKQFVI